MKIRILDNSLRLRLRRSEVQRFAAEGRVAAQSEFAGGAVLEYRLEAGDTDRLEARLEPGRITVTVPREQAEHWTGSEQVGIEGVCGPLAVLIEKDFQRTHVKGLYDFDLYPNPRRAQA